MLGRSGQIGLTSKWQLVEELGGAEVDFGVLLVEGIKFLQLGDSSRFQQLHALPDLTEHGPIRVVVSLMIGSFSMIEKSRETHRYLVRGAATLDLNSQPPLCDAHS